LDSRWSSKIVKLIPLIVIGIMLTGAFTSSCRHYPTSPTDTTKCDTCCDTCHTDTTHHPCDTCNKASDTTSHDFQWTEYTIPEESNLTGVWVFNDTDILIIGNILWHFNGNTFSDVKPIRNGSNTELSGALNGFTIFALSKLEYWMVHAGGSVAFHTIDGKHFDDIRPGATGAIWGSSKDDIFIVGNGGKIHHYDGTKFTDMVSGTTKNLRAVWGTSHNDVWTTGYNSATDESVLLHFDGTSWTEDEFSTTNKVKLYGIGDVWATDSSGHRLAVISGTRVFRKTDDGSWRMDTSDLKNSLGGGSYIGIGAYGGTPNDMVCVGGWGYISHWNGRTWFKYDKFFDYSNSFYGPGGVSMRGNTICIVGVKSGQSWIAVGRRK
jgi:hypothetical protein